MTVSLGAIGDVLYSRTKQLLRLGRVGESGLHAELTKSGALITYSPFIGQEDSRS